MSFNTYNKIVGFITTIFGCIALFIEDINIDTDAIYCILGYIVFQISYIKD